ncbi:MAG: hypothetical protein AAFY91_12525 [Bacteroidota bacterium]
MISLIILMLINLGIIANEEDYFDLSQETREYYEAEYIGNEDGVFI